MRISTTRGKIEAGNLSSNSYTNFQAPILPRQYKKQNEEIILRQNMTFQILLNKWEAVVTNPLPVPPLVPDKTLSYARGGLQAASIALNVSYFLHSSDGSRLTLYYTMHFTHLTIFLKPL